MPGGNSFCVTLGMLGAGGNSFCVTLGMLGAMAPLLNPPMREVEMKEIVEKLQT